MKLSISFSQRLRVLEQRNVAQRRNFGRSGPRRLPRHLASAASFGIQIGDDHFHIRHENSMRIIHSQSLFGRYCR